MPTVALRERTEAPPQQRVQQQQQQQAAAQPQLATPQPAPQPRAAAPVIGASVDPVVAQQTWESQVVAAIERGKRYPPGAQFARQEDTILVRLAISHAGSVSGVKLLRSKRYELLDAEARAVVQRVKLPPPPASIDTDPVVVTVPIQFYLQGQ